MLGVAAPSYVRVLLPRLARWAAIDKRVHRHGLRHTHAAELRAEGVDVGVISRQLGHASLLTTIRYLDHIAPRRWWRRWERGGDKRIDARQREAAWRGTIMGGKYPHLCFMIDLLLELEPESRFIHIDRPIEESIHSLVDRSTKARGLLRATPEQCERLQRALWEAKTEGLGRLPSGRALTLEYRDLLADPSQEVHRIAQSFALPVRQGQLERAAALIEPRR